MHDPDVSNFSPPSAHRLPTISASQALQDRTTPKSRSISTSLRSLDAALQRNAYPGLHMLAGGISRGQITEVYGPPGVGKTTFAMQVAANVLRNGESVNWIDTSSHVHGPRFRQILSAGSTTSALESADPGPYLDNFNRWKCPTLAHLFALLMHPAGAFPTPGAGIVIIDSVSTLFDLSFPRTGTGTRTGNERPSATTAKQNGKDNPTPKRELEIRQWAAGRRFAVMGDLISKLSKVAALKNAAVLLVNQTTTRLRFEGTGSARLVPMLGGNTWDVGIWSRIVLVRDWGSCRCAVHGDGDAQGLRQQGVRYAAVQKVARTMPREDVFALKIVPFVIDQNGIREIVEFETHQSLPDMPLPEHPHPPALSQKRKHDEIADSQSEEGDLGSGEDYGWIDEDDMIAANEGAVSERAEGPGPGSPEI